MLGRNSWYERYGMREYRAIACLAVGYLLPPEMHVHHIDEDRSNNAPENLEILTKDEHELLHRGEPRPNPMKGRHYGVLSEAQLNANRRNIEVARKAPARLPALRAAKERDRAGV
jgi:hypothetical protein